MTRTTSPVWKPDGTPINPPASRVKKAWVTYRRKAKCAAIFDPDQRIVMFVELMSNPGMSVTNAIEDVADEFLKEHGGSKPTKIDWRFFEAYEERIRAHGFDPDLAEVVFDSRTEEPKWLVGRASDIDPLLKIAREM